MTLLPPICKPIRKKLKRRHWVRLLALPGVVGIAGFVVWVFFAGKAYASVERTFLELTFAFGPALEAHGTALRVLCVFGVGLAICFVLSTLLYYAIERRLRVRYARTPLCLGCGYDLRGHVGDPAAVIHCPACDKERAPS